jgi:phosphoglycolate phosphatase-like HAD superfamily hydrolase
MDSLPLVLAAIRHAIEPFGGAATMDIFASLGGPPERFMAGLVSDPAQVPEALRRMYAFHNDNFHLIRPYAGVGALVEDLGRQAVKLAVWTGRDRASTEVLMRKHRLSTRFAAVVCGDDLASHKPDPAGLREILRRLGASADETLLVGDADVDVLGGHACGVATLLIRHQRTVNRAILEKSWQVVGTPEEAYARVLGWVGEWQEKAAARRGNPEGTGR